MFHSKRWRIFSLWLAALASGHAAADSLVDSTVLVARSERYEQAAAPPHTFTISTAGRYRLDVRDVQFPASLASVDVIVTKGTQSIARLSRFGTIDFDTTSGVHVVHVLAGGASPGTVGIAIAAVTGGSPLVDVQFGIQPNPAVPADAVSSFDQQIAVTASGSYRLSLTDRQFPVTLANYDAALFTQGGSMVARICAPAIAAVCGSGPIDISLGIGTYDLAVRAESALPQKSGLISIRLGPASGPGSADVYAATHAVGTLEASHDLDFPADDQYGFLISDLNFPSALVQAKAVIVQGSEVLVSAPGVLSVPIAFTAKQGSATLYTVATPSTSNGVGTAGVIVSRNSQTIFSAADAAVAPTATTTRAYAFLTTIPAAGRYRFQARDFGFPATIPALQFLVVQDGVSLGAYSVGGSLTVSAKAGPVLVIAIANILNSSATGLFNVSIESESGGARLVDLTQGVGDVFQKRQLTATKSGGLDVTLSDLRFPQGFEELLAVVTRGDVMTGYILGNGTFSFAATPGEYTLNFVAKNSAGVNYGLYGLKIQDSPLPTVSLSASTPSVNSGETATLTWSSTGATSCTASGGWTGTRGLLGTEATAALSKDTTWTLTCNGAGGTASADTKISVAPVTANAASGSGNLSMTFVFLIGLMIVLRSESARRAARAASLIA